MNHGVDDGGTGAANFPGSRKDLNANNVLGGNERTPRRRHGGLAGKIGDAAIDHRLDGVVVRLKIGHGIRV